MKNEIEIRWALLEPEAEERPGGHSEQAARETAGNGTAVPKVSGQEQTGRQPLWPAAGRGAACPPWEGSFWRIFFWKAMTSICPGRRSPSPGIRWASRI